MLDSAKVGFARAINRNRMSTLFQLKIRFSRMNLYNVVVMVRLGVDAKRRLHSIHEQVA